MRARALEAARGWLGTPYAHQQSTQGAGCDCLGLVRGVWRALYGCEPGPVPRYSRDWAEPGREEALWRSAARHMAELAPEDARPGDVLLFRMARGAVAKHLGVLSAAASDPRFIHAYDGHGVVESPLSRPWARRVVAAFRFPQGGA